MTAVRIYADSADSSEVVPLLQERLIAGVTTNPTILTRAGLTASDIPARHREWLALGAEEVFFQSWGRTSDELVAIGRALAALGGPVVVKVPASAIGIPAAARLAGDGIPVLVTAVYTLPQAIAAAAVGAHYVAPYFGRLGDAGRDALAEITAMHRALDGTGADVLVASVRSPSAVGALVAAGIRHVTAAPRVIRGMFTDPTSDAAITEFDDASHGWRLEARDPSPG